MANATEMENVDPDLPRVTWEEVSRLLQKINSLDKRCESRSILIQLSKVHEMVEQLSEKGLSGSESKNHPCAVRICDTCFQFAGDSTYFCQNLDNIHVLMTLLSHSNQFIAHISSKMLICFSDHFKKSVTVWRLFFKMLCNTARNWCSFLEENTNVEASDSNNTSADNRDFRSIMNLVLILQNTGKNLCCGASEEMVVMAVLTYIEFISIILNSSYIHARDNQTVEKDKKLLLASLLRLLSTSVHNMEHFHADGTMKQISYLLEDIGCLLRPLTKAVHPHVINYYGCPISGFLCYKYLMVLFRLSNNFETVRVLAICCLESLGATVEHIINVSIMRRCPASSNVLLFESPFMSSLLPNLDHAISLETKVLLSMHLQRRALYLVFKVFIAVSHMPESTHMEKDGPHVGMEHVPASTERNLNPPQEAGEILMDWAERQISSMMHQAPCSLSSQLGQAFIELYSHEDDMMIKVLLLLLDFPIALSCFESKARGPTLKLLKSTFAPLTLFHMFLAVISYDYSVLVDLLIAPNTGDTFLCYLMRCLRLLVGTWPTFLHSKPEGIFSSMPAERSGRKHHTSQHREEAWDISSVKAGACLGKLAKAIKKMHGKEVFPYNPRPLLKRLEAAKQLFKGSIHEGSNCTRKRKIQLKWVGSPIPSQQVQQVPAAQSHQ